MGTQAEYWTDIYATTHEQRLAQSMETARKELVDKYQANATYVGYLRDLIKLQEESLTKQQQALQEFETARGGKKASIDDTAKLLGVIAQAGGDIADATGDAAQRKLESEAAVQKRYQISPTQAGAISDIAGELSPINLNAITNSADLNRFIRSAIDNNVGPGVFDPQSDAAKTAASEMFATIDAALTNNPVYLADKANVQSLMQADVAAVLGVDPQFVDKQNLEVDKRTAIAKAQQVVGVTGTGTSAKAARLAEQALQGKLGVLSDKDSKEVAEWFTSPEGQAYVQTIQAGGNMQEAVEAAGKIKGLDPEKVDVQATLFKLPSGRDIQTVLAEGGSFDIAKFFNPAYVDLFKRTRQTGQKLSDTQEKFAAAVEGLSDVPTEEAVRRRGTEIYEPISPGVKGREREASARLEEARQRDPEGFAMLRKSAGAGTVDDFLASRLTQGALSDTQRILAGASGRAVRELDNPPRGRVGTSARVPGDTALGVEDYEAMGGEEGPASLSGQRMFVNVRDRQLRDISPDALVKYAADLAGGDPALRDDILKEYYKRSLAEMRSTRVSKAATDVEKAERKGPPPTPPPPQAPPMTDLTVPTKQEVIDFLSQPPTEPQKKQAGSILDF